MKMGPQTGPELSRRKYTMNEFKVVPVLGLVEGGEDEKALMSTIRIFLFHFGST